VNFFAGNSKIWRPNAENLDVKAGIFAFKSSWSHAQCKVHEWYIRCVQLIKSCLAVEFLSTAGKTLSTASKSFIK
jgi:hypothetical protein